MENLQRSPESVTKEARRVFLLASRKAPSSKTGQAAFIAEHCLSTGLDPIQGRKALVSDPDTLSNIEAIAIMHHRAAQKGPATIGREQTIAVVTTDFTLASEMMCLPPDQLKRLYSVHYPEVRASTPPGEDFEARMEEISDKMIEDLKRKSPGDPRIPVGGLRNW